MQNYQQYSDEKLLELYQKADFKAFEEFYRRHQRLIFNFLIYKLASRTDAEEVVQETFLKIHRSILSYDPKQKALAWVFSIAKNTMIDFWNHRKKHHHQTLNFDIRHDQEQSLQAKLTVEGILAQLNADEQQIIKARYLEEISYEQLAKDLNLEQDNVRQKVSRLLKKIKTNF